MDSEQKKILCILFIRWIAVINFSFCFVSSLTLSFENLFIKWEKEKGRERQMEKSKNSVEGEGEEGYVMEETARQNERVEMM